MSTSSIVIKIMGDASGLTAAVSGVNRSLGSLDASADKSALASSRLSSALGKIGHYGLAGGGLYGVAAAVSSVSGALFSASASAQRLSTQMQFASNGNGAREMAFAASVANRLGLEITSTTQAYAGFASAARGTTLEGQRARSVFEALSKASAVMGLSTEQTSGALLAVQQMMSKGVVSAEEFRGQLGERMPIALQAGARALGVTTAEFSKLLETGKIVADDFLPKFAAAINDMVGGAAEQAAESLDKSVNRMGNAWTRLKQTIGDSGISSALADGAGVLAKDMTALDEAMRTAEIGGGGFFRQMNDGLGMLIGRALGLQYVNRDFMTLKGAAEDARATLARLDAQEKNDGKLSVYSMDERARAARDLARSLALLKQMESGAGEGAGGGRGSVNPATVAQMAEAEARRLQAQAAVRLEYASAQEKMNEALAKARIAFDGVLPPELEQRIREKFIKPTNDAAAAAKKVGLETATFGEALFKGEQQRLEFLAKMALAAQTRQAEAENASEERRASADEMVSSIQRETAMLNLSNIEREVAVALLELEKLGIEAGTEAYDAYSEKLRGAIVGREAVRESIAQTKQIGDEWKRTTDQIGQSLSDSLFRAFESGRSFFDTLWQSIKNTIKTTVMRVVIEPIMGGISGAVSGAIGGNAAAGTSRLGQGLSLASSGQSLAGLGAAFSSNTYAAAYGNATGTGLDGMLAANNGFGTAGSGISGASLAAYAAGAAVGVYGGRAVSGGYSTGGSGNTAVNVGTAIGAAIAGPIGAAIGGLAGGVFNRAFGRKDAESTGKGIEGSFGGGNFGGNTFNDWRAKGGWFRSDKTGTDRGSLDAATEAFLDSTAKTMLVTAKEYGELLGLPVEALQRVTTTARVQLTDDATKNGEAIQAALTRYGDDLLAGYSSAVAKFAKAGETIGQTIERLTGLQSFSKTITQLGGAFSKIASLGYEARESMASLAGGMDQFTSQALGFAQQYYNRDEIAGIKAAEVKTALDGAGIATFGLDDKGDYRSLLESRDANTESGRQQIATLLSSAEGYAQLSDYMAEKGLTLSQVAAQSPSNSVLRGASDAQLQAAGQTNTWLGQIADMMRRLVDRQTEPGRMYAPREVWQP